MKKEEKIIKIRTAAKIKLENLKAEMMAAKSEAAQRHADIMEGKLYKCDNERFNEIERFKAEKMAVEADFYHKKAALYAETETACQEAVDDDDPKPEPEKEEPRTVYCDGSEHSTRIVARRLINKLPHIPKGGAITVMISHGDGSLSGEYWLTVTTNNGGEWPENIRTVMFDKNNPRQEIETSFVDEVRASFDARKEGENE